MFRPYFRSESISFDDQEENNQSIKRSLTFDMDEEPYDQSGDISAYQRFCETPVIRNKDPPIDLPDHNLGLCTTTLEAEHLLFTARRMPHGTEDDDDTDDDDEELTLYQSRPFLRRSTFLRPRHPLERNRFPCPLIMSSSSDDRVECSLVSGDVSSTFGTSKIGTSASSKGQSTLNLRLLAVHQLSATAA